MPSPGGNDHQWSSRLYIPARILRIPMCFPFLWCFFHRNQDSCSAVTFSERHKETCLYGAYVESYVGYQFVRQKQSTIQFFGTLQWLLSTTIAAPPPPLLRCHCCTATTTATPIVALPSPLPSLRRHRRRCAAIAVAGPPKPSLHRLSGCCTAIALAAPQLPLLRCHCRCCATIAIAAPPPSLPLLRPSLRRRCCTAMMETGDNE
jgi:hypothetical protein